MVNFPILLPHEHIYSRHRRSDRYAASHFISEALNSLVRYGVRDVVDLTAYVNPVSCLSLTEHSNVRVHSCVGFYLENFVRKDLRTKSGIELGDLLVRRYNRQRDKMSTVAIKVAARSQHLSPFEKRSFEAAAYCQLQTGLPIVTHSPKGGLAHQQYLISLGVSAEQIMLSHIELGLKGQQKQTYSELLEELLEIIRLGSYVCITDVYPASSQADSLAINIIAAAIRAGYANKLMVSGDASWRSNRGELHFRGVQSKAAEGFGLALCARQKLLARGVSESELEQLYSRNPYDFYRVEKRK